MALDRQSIERKDFPVGHNGYEPAVVDEHLSALADELDEFKQAARRRSETLASSASEQVRAIVQAAETSAADIQRAAEEEAREIKADADREAHSIREQASDEARESFGKVSESTVVMLQRLDSMESELNALIESLRTGADRLNSDLRALEGHVGEVGASLERPPAFQPEPDPEPEPEVAPPAEPEQAYEPPTYVSPGDEALVAPTSEPTDEPAQDTYDPPTYDPPPAEPSPDPGWGQTPSAPDQSAADAGWDESTAPEEPDAGTGWGDSPVAEPATEHGFEPPAPPSDDTEGARLIALNMALNGTPRDETARYLGENFQLPDPDGLLDEVYSSVED